MPRATMLTEELAIRQIQRQVLPFSEQPVRISGLTKQLYRLIKESTECRIKFITAYKCFPLLPVNTVFRTMQYH